MSLMLNIYLHEKTTEHGWSSGSDAGSPNVTYSGSNQSKVLSIELISADLLTVIKWLPFFIVKSA